MAYCKTAVALYYCKHQSLALNHWYDFEGFASMSRHEAEEKNFGCINCWADLRYEIHNKKAAILQTIKFILLNENQNCILIHISLKFVPNVPIDNRPTLVQIKQCYSNTDMTSRSIIQTTSEKIVGVALCVHFPCDILPCYWRASTTGQRQN